MDDLIKGLVSLALASAVGLVVGCALRAVRLWRNRRTMPTAEKKTELIAMIQQWKAEGRLYSERLQLLKKQGMRQDVADVLLGEAEKANSAR